jgi:hypothetical protein
LPFPSLRGSRAPAFFQVAHLLLIDEHLGSPGSAKSIIVAMNVALFDAGVPRVRL